MQKINLYTAEGEFVTTVECPNFKPMYEVIAWGCRFFLLDPDDGKYKEKAIYVVSL